MPCHNNTHYLCEESFENNDNKMKYNFGRVLKPKLFDDVYNKAITKEFNLKQLEDLTQTTILLLSDDKDLQDKCEIMLNCKISYNSQRLEDKWEKISNFDSSDLCNRIIEVQNFVPGKFELCNHYIKSTPLFNKSV